MGARAADASGKGAAQPRWIRMDNPTMELLAPAGDEAALRAAVNAGADAVYLGYTRFGARTSASNFDAEGLERAIAYAHLHRVRVHVTVNTLVKPDELEAVSDALATIAACQADAVIVQDLGVARLARERFPGLALHASTQMALHTASGAQFAREHGFERVVLARECTLKTIAAVARTGVETEVFVHGALCASVSGQCLLSSMAGGRSGNRGRCAQPCRQTVTLGGESLALLSLKDLCLRNDLPALRDAGVASLKIEGRLKRAEYVAVVTHSYRKALDALARGDFQPMADAERTELLQIFHRGGFTRGHAMGEEDADLCSVRRVGHGGVPVGMVAGVRDGLATLSLTRALHDGDSLLLGGEQELRYAGPESEARALLHLRPGVRVRIGDPVTRLADAIQLQWAQSLAEQAIPVTLRARVLAGQPLWMAASDGNVTVEATGEPAQTPIRRALTRDEILRSLTKLGDTPYALAAAPTLDCDEAFTPLSALNALRRQALEALTDARRAFFVAQDRTRTSARDIRRSAALDVTVAAAVPLEPAAQRQVTPVSVEGGKAYLPNATHNRLADPSQVLAVRFSDPAMAESLLASGATRLLYAPNDFRPAALKNDLARLPVGVWLVLPPQLHEDTFAAFVSMLGTGEGQLSGLVLGSVGQLGFPRPLPVALGEGVPVCNPLAARELLTDAIAFYTCWPELSGTELLALGSQRVPALLPVYGRERVMLLNHCPLRVSKGLQSGRSACALCGAEDRACADPDAALTDRRGYRFPLQKVRMPEGCVLEMYNALPTDLSRQENIRLALGAGMLLRFTTEPPDRQLTITRRFAALLHGEGATPPDEPVTGGHLLRGVE